MNNSHIQNRALKNSIVGLISFVFSLAQAIIIVPVLLKYWGNEKYGIWLALYAGFSLLQSIDNGHINYTGNEINITYHTDKNECKKTLSSSFLMAIIIGSVQILIVVLLILYNCLQTVIGIDPEIFYKNSIHTSILILIIGWLFSGSFGGILHRLMIPTGFYYQAQWWGILYRFCQFISIIIVALIGGSILEASVFYVLIQFIVYGLTFYYIKIKIPEFYPWWKGAELKIAFFNFKKSIVFTFTGFVQQLSNNGLILLVSYIFSSVFLPIFTSIRTMANTALSITNLLINSVLPDFVRYHANKEKEKLYSVFNANWFFSGLVVNIGLITVIPFADYIFKVWTKGIIDFDFNLFISLAASISVINFGAGLYNYLYSINNLKAVTVITITRVIILFLFSYYLSGSIGLSGIGAAILISEIFSSMILPYFFVKQTLKSFGGRLNLKTIIIALGTPVILILIAIFQLIGIKFNYYIWGVSLLVIILIYIFNWIKLDKEVKERTLLLIRNLFKSIYEKI